MNKIVIISNGIGIVYKFRLELLKELRKKKKEISIISPIEEVDKKFYELLKQENIQIYKNDMNRRGKNLFQELKVLKQYYSILKKINPDKVLSYTIKPNIYGGIICQILKLEFIPTVTGIGTAFQKEGILKKIVVFLNKVALRKSKKVFFQNKTNLQIYLENRIISKEQSYLVNGSGINLKRFKYDIQDKNNPIKILFIGRIMEEKGIEEFIEVAKRIKGKYKEKIEFNILGQYEEYKYRDIIKKLQIQGIVKYLGISNDVRKELKEVHCLVNPSWHEGMSNVLLEAGAMKRFLIASDIPGCKEIVVNNKTGFTFEKQNIDDLEAKIEIFMNLSDEEYQQYIENSYNHIKSNFSREKVIEEYLNILNQ